MRVFCNYLNDIGIPAYVSPKGLAGRSPKYDAHIYNSDELKRFFSAVDKSQSLPSECPYRGLVMPIFFRILYTSGLRVSELRLVKVKDVNLDKGCITVKNAKNHKDWIVPIRPELVNKYTSLKKAIHTSSSACEYFFMIRPGQAMSLVNVYRNFSRETVIEFLEWYRRKGAASITAHKPDGCQYTYRAASQGDSYAPL